MIILIAAAPFGLVLLIAGALIFGIVGTRNASKFSGTTIKPESSPSAKSDDDNASESTETDTE